MTRDLDSPTVSEGDRGRRSAPRLDRLLAALAPALDRLPYRFVQLGSAPSPDALFASTFALVREREGWTRIERSLGETEAARTDARGPAAPEGADWARIELTVRSDLAAIGLTAAVTAALAAEGIPANVVAACNHDHLFVPWEDRERALATLERLSDAARRSGAGD